MTMQFNGTSNLVLPAASEQMRWGYIEYNAALGATTYDLSYQNQEGTGLIPQAIIVDTTGLTGGPLAIVWDINGVRFPLSVNSGIKRSYTVPAVKNLQFSLNAGSGSSGTVRLDMVNFPMIPENFAATSSVTVSSSGTSDVNVTNATSSPVPISVQGTPSVTVSNSTSAPVPISVQGTPSVTVFNSTSEPVPISVLGNPVVFVSPVTATLVSGTATASGSTTIGTPPASTNLRRLILSITENATMATAGENVVTIALNGVTVFTESVYIPATALASNGVLYKRDIPFLNVAFYVGTSGTLTATLGTALATGSLNINAYFDQGQI